MISCFNKTIGWKKRKIFLLFFFIIFYLPNNADDDFPSSFFYFHSFILLDYFFFVYVVFSLFILFLCSFPILFICEIISHHFYLFLNHNVRYIRLNRSACHLNANQYKLYDIKGNDISCKICGSMNFDFYFSFIFPNSNVFVFTPKKKSIYLVC